MPRTVAALLLAAAVALTAPVAAQPNPDLRMWLIERIEAAHARGDHAALERMVRAQYAADLDKWLDDLATQPQVTTQEMAGGEISVCPEGQALGGDGLCRPTDCSVPVLNGPLPDCEGTEPWTPIDLPPEPEEPPEPADQPRPPIDVPMIPDPPPVNQIPAICLAAAKKAGKCIAESEVICRLAEETEEGTAERLDLEVRCAETRVTCARLLANAVRICKKLL